MRTVGKIIDSSAMSFYCAPSSMSGTAAFLVWEPFMRRAMAAAQGAEGRGDVPVGALVVSGAGEVLGVGENRTICDTDPTAHAEILAMRAACSRVRNYRLTDAVLVVTLEPCIMCVGAIIQARLAGVVYAARDHKAGCLASRLAGADLPWSNHHFWSLGGVLEEECSQMLSSFFQRRRKEKKNMKQILER